VVIRPQKKLISVTFGGITSLVPDIRLNRVTETTSRPLGRGNPYGMRPPKRKKPPPGKVNLLAINEQMSARRKDLSTSLKIRKKGPGR